MSSTLPIQRAHSARYSHRSLPCFRVEFADKARPTANMTQMIHFRSFNDGVCVCASQSHSRSFFSLVRSFVGFHLFNAINIKGTWTNFFSLPRPSTAIGINVDFSYLSLFFCSFSASKRKKKMWGEIPSVIRLKLYEIWLEIKWYLICVCACAWTVDVWVCVCMTEAQVECDPGIWYVLNVDSESNATHKAHLLKSRGEERSGLERNKTEWCGKSSSNKSQDKHTYTHRGRIDVSCATNAYV